MYTDRPIACLDCGQEFAFTAGEQEFYAQRGFTEPPKRCPSCRAVRKAQRSGASSGGDRGSYGSSASSSSGYERSGNGYGGGGYATAERRPRQMFEAPCAECGKMAQLPFQPTGARPVYCSDCFQTRRA